jgi:hypothetical protein
MYPWLYLLTRSEGETVELSDKICAGNKCVEESFRRMAALTQEETKELRKEVDQELAQLGSIQAAEVSAKQGGMEEGIREGERKEKNDTARQLLRKRKDPKSSFAVDQIKEASA